MRRTQDTGATQTGAGSHLAQPASAIPSPARIGRYAVLGMLGRGGMGEVYLGLDEQLARQVAIKVLSRASEPAQVSGRLRREALALACLAHPNVVAIHEVGEADGQVYLVMERVDGATLRGWLSERRRGVDEVLAVMLQAGRGLAAAHAAGLIHRDFKPENIMIGADGRVRVMDFGLACTATNPEAEITRTMVSGRMQLLDGATSAGLGTPGYMAPEQYMEVPHDVRCDVFSFCVVLFEALHGQRPFPGEGFQATRESILRGALVRVGRGEAPAWLDAVIHRGLLGDPEQRWPSIDALLTALQRRSPPYRRRALQGVGVLALTAAVGLAGSAELGALGRADAEALAEQLADERLAAVEAIVGGAAAHDEHELAEATFQAFVSDPAHRGTRALARAWQRRGDQRLADGAGEDALNAYARAYLEAREPAAAAELMRTIGTVFRDRWDGPALAQALATLRARGLDTPADAVLMLDAALLQGDLTGAAALAASDPAARAWAPLLTTLAQAHPGGRSSGKIVALPPGGAAALVALDIGGQEVALLDRSLAPIRRVRAEGRHLGLVSGAPWVQVFAGGEAEVLDLGGAGGSPRSLWRGPAERPIHLAHALDLNRDGAPELLLSYRWPQLGFHVLSGLGGPAATRAVAHAASDGNGSELAAVWSGDLDDDGSQEVVAAFGAWTAFDLRVFRAGDDGGLELLARRRFGHVTALTSLRRGDERLLVVVNDEHCPDPESFPIAPHTGEVAGVHLLRWDGAALLDAGLVPLPRNATAPIQSGGVAIAADLDGDAVEELVVELVPARTTLLIRQGEAGLEHRLVQGMRPLAAAQLDDDPASELLVRAGPDDALWVLGLGDVNLPRLGPAPAPSRAVPSSLRDPLLAQRWVRADELASVGLPAPAAASLREVIGLAADPVARRELQDHAADLLVRAGDDAGAVALTRDADPDPSPAALARDAAALARLGRYDEAHAAAEAVLAHPGRAPEQVAAVTVLRDRFAALVPPASRLDLDFSGPLAPAWDIARPASLRREAGGDGLHLMIASDMTPVAALPLTWDGGPLSLEFEVDVERLEYGACVWLAVVDRNDEVWLGAGVCAIGGGGRVLHIDRCMLGGRGWVEFAEREAPADVTSRRVVARIAGFADGTAECSVADDVRRQYTSQVGAVSPVSGPLRLVLGAFVDHVEPTLALATLRRVTIRGAGAAATEARHSPQADAAHHLVEGDPLAALAALDTVVVSDPRDPLLRALAANELRDLAELGGAVTELLPRLGDRSWRPDLALLLRTRPAAGMALQQVAGSRLLPVMGFTWGSLRTHLRDPQSQRAVLAELSGIDAMRPVAPDERHALRRLLVLRAELRQEIGDHAAARSDLEAALAVPPVATDADVEERVQAHLQLVRMLVALDPARARAHAHAAVAISARPELVRDRLAAVPGLP